MLTTLQQVEGYFCNNIFHARATIYSYPVNLQRANYYPARFSRHPLNLTAFQAIPATNDEADSLTIKPLPLLPLGRAIPLFGTTHSVLTRYCFADLDVAKALTTTRIFPSPE